MTELALALTLVALLLLLWLAWRFASLQRHLDELPGVLGQGLEERHRAMLADLHSGLTQQGDRVGGHLAESSERLRSVVADELRQTRDTLHALRLSLAQDLGPSRA